MSITFITFNSVGDFKRYVDQTIAEVKSAMGIQMRTIDEVKRRPGSAKGPKNPSEQSQRKELAGFNVLVNPTAEHELKLLEETFSTHQDKLMEFEKVKELYPHLKEEMKVGVVLEEGIPTGFMLYTDK
ncbi:MAG: hypothetical protein ACREAW_07910 [Nitrososphaera sp.]